MGFTRYTDGRSYHLYSIDGELITVLLRNRGFESYTDPHPIALDSEDTYLPDKRGSVLHKIVSNIKYEYVKMGGEGDGRFERLDDAMVNPKTGFVL